MPLETYTLEDYTACKAAVVAKATELGNGTERCVLCQWRMKIWSDSMDLSNYFSHLVSHEVGCNRVNVVIEWIMGQVW